MIEELISFETAKLAKEKGFHLPCYNHCFIGNTGETVYEKSVHCINWSNRPNIKSIQKYSTPTQSLLQKWLREEHNIHIMTMTDDFEQYGMCLDVKDDPDNSGYWAYYYKSYEDAIEQGLIEALKLL